MSVYKDMAHDAGYRGDAAEQVAQSIEQDHMRQAMERQEQEQEPHPWQCQSCGEVNRGAYCPCSYEVQDDGEQQAAALSEIDR